MSRHSKNNTSSSVFTYGQRQKLKGTYGTIDKRVGQDSLKKFQMCTLCSNRLIEPTSCDKGHMFCRSCAIEYLVKKKKKQAENGQQYRKHLEKEKQVERQKQLQEKVKNIEQFQQYETYLKIQKKPNGQISKPTVTQNDVKPIGCYELNPDKDKYLKSSFWTVQNTPKFEQKVIRQDKKIMCPGSEHHLSLKKLRAINCKSIEGVFLCWICNKDINRQRIGSYKCGHLVCHDCKSKQCEMCSEKDGWIQIQRSYSSFSGHNKSEIKTYTHAFLM